VPLALKLVVVLTLPPKILESRWQQEQVESSDVSAMPLDPKLQLDNMYPLRILVNK